jgi:hypothetical protein
MSTNWNLEFLNHNSQRSYPLTADSSKLDLSGDFKIPSDLLVGLDLPVPGSYSFSDHRFFIRQIAASGSGLQLIVGYQNAANASTDIAYAKLLYSSFQPYSTVPLLGYPPYEDVVGKVSFGDIAGVIRQPAGLFNFDLEGSRIEPQAIRQTLRGVQGIRVRTALGSVSPWLYGDVELAAGENVRLDVVTTGGVTKIVVNSILGEGSSVGDECIGQDVSLPCITRINNIRPDLTGNFNLVAGTCIQLQPETAGIRITNTCAETCCSCAELEAITRDLVRFAQERAQLSDYVNRIGTENSSFITNVLGSRLGDGGCVNCE